MSGLIVVIKYLIRAIIRKINPPKSASNTSLKSKPSLSNSEDNKWIINGKVYDLSKFMSVHPGGKHMLLLNRGRDCTELFFMYHLPSNKPLDHMLSILSKYYVCDASPKQIKSPFSWTGKNYEMYLDLKSRVQSHFDRQQTINGGISAHIKYFLLHSNRDKASFMRLSFYFFLFLCLMVTHYFWFQQYWFAIPMLSLSHWLFSTGLLHDGTHYCMVNNANWNYINYLLSFFGGFYHVPNVQWEMQHVISHHSYTNMNTFDIDLNHFLDNFRTSKTQKYKSIYGKWRYFIAIYMLFTSIGQVDIWGANVNRNIHRLMVPFWSKGDNKSIATDVLFLYFVQVLWIFMILPLSVVYAFGVDQFFKAFLFVILPRVGHGVLFYIFSQISHVQGDAFYDGEEVLNDNWIIHQIQSCVDYDIYSLFWNIMSIGLNNQVIHHLCPSVHPSHYVSLQPVLNKFCEDYKIKRRVRPNIFLTLKSHFKHLANVNDTAGKETK